jgi:hypothetical protein
MLRLTHWLLLGIAITVTYLWCVRIGDDLNWDEAASYRKYARNPVTAGAYMHDSNNHPGESLFRSLFFGVLGMSSPAFYRFAGFLILLGFLAAAWRWHRLLESSGAIFAATIAVLLLFLSHAIHEQAMVLRGYFPTIVLGVAWFLLVARWSGILGSTGTPPRPMTRGERWKLAALSGVILYVLPSNAVLMLVIWPATAMAFGSTLRANRVVQVISEATKLGILGGLCAAILYLPILATLALGHRYDRDALPLYPVVDVSTLQAIRDEVLLVIQQIQPGPFADVFTGRYHRHPVSEGTLPDLVYAALGIALLAASIALRRRERATHVAWWLLLATTAGCAALAAVNETPPRIRSPFVVPILFAALFLTHAVASRWSPREQIAASLAAIAIGYAALVAPVRATAFDRRASDLAAVLETIARPAERRALVAHANQRNLLPYLHRAFGDAWTLDKAADVRTRFSPAPPATRAGGAFERWVREKFFPEPGFPRLRPEDVDVLVLVGDKESTRGGAIEWSDPSLDAIKKRLSRVSTLRRDARDLEIWEKP